MEDVAAAAQVSRQTLYLQFHDKERLFRAALEYVTGQMLVSMTRLAPIRTAPWTKHS
jgi:AcrR family transcriptional regulator